MSKKERNAFLSTLFCLVFLIIGKMLIAVVVNRDYPLVQGAVLVITLGVLIVNFTTQALITLLNPKARHSQQSQSLVFKKQASPKRYGG